MIGLIALGSLGWLVGSVPLGVLIGKSIRLADLQ